MSILLLMGLGLLAFVFGFWLTQRWQQTQAHWTQAQASPPVPPLPAAPTGQGVLESQVQTLVAQKQTIAAIKLVRQRTGWGLKQAKDYVDNLVCQPGYGLDNASPPPNQGLTAGIQQQVRQMVSNHQKIAAIKLVREQTGWDLRTAKDYVEQFE